jgi:hypothetical protein
MERKAACFEFTFSVENSHECDRKNRQRRGRSAAGTKLPEGAEVKIETIATDDPFLAAVERLAKPRPHLPKDYALNHGHYLRGEPKK